MAMSGAASGRRIEPADAMEAVRREEFSRLDQEGQVYLDYTGSALYPQSLVRGHAEALCRSVLGNPHSRNPSSRAATEIVESVRERVLDFFDGDPDEHEVVFTPNATGALKLVAEAFGFARGSRLLLTSDNHNSAHGIREYAAARGAEVTYVPLGEELRVHGIEAYLSGVDRGARNLFVFPAQSNFSGVQHPLPWIGAAQAAGYRVFLDAAAFVPTSRLSMRRHAPDFACVSFYKMFGYPTGVGALLARRDALRELRRPWFSGGTVRFVSAQQGVELLYGTSRGFEDGTLNFLGIAAVRSGLDFLERIGMTAIGDHVRRLTELLLSRMRTLSHANGAPLVQIYGPAGIDHRGGTVAFNVTDPEGRIWDFRRVDEGAAAAGVSLRTGYFCNPGAAEYALSHPDADVRRCAGRFTPESFNIQEFSECLDDRAVGAVRVSLGIPSNERDVEAFVALLDTFRDQTSPPPTRDV
jgi:molybdenum cofactor sulfurtransferase